MVTIDTVIARAKEYMPQVNVERIRRAYDFAAKAHEGQTRFSGEPYIIHPLNVANILIDYHPDEDSIITAILHDVAEDTSFTIEDIEAHFGSAVSKLCWGLVKLSKVRSKLNDPQIENLRKLFLAMAEDIRVVMLKLCDRLHNMKTLNHVLPHKQVRIAQETMNVYAPIAARLGIYKLKTELEDLCFKYLQPSAYEDIHSQLEKAERWRERFIESSQKTLYEMLSKEGIQAKVDGRVKGLYSIYRKLKKKNKTLVDEIFDVFAMRIILPDMYRHGKEYTGHLYTTLGIIHNHFTPLANRFKDYVAVPKVNGYRSLHTTVIGLGPKNYNRPTEIQIRSLAMHNASEYGIAAHWIYEDKGVISKDDFAIDTVKLDHLGYEEDDDEGFFEQQKGWITDLNKIGQEVQNNQELLSHLHADVLQDRIFVLTPRGDVKDLPTGATPVDFAYSVHTEVGNHCIGAKVNGSMVPIDYQLKNGEVVEILTRKSSTPSQSWLSFVKTTHAINRVKSWFRTRDDEKNIKDGKDLLNEKLAQLGKPPLDMSLSVLKVYDGKKVPLKERQEILAEIGRGSLLTSTVLRKIFTMQELLGASKILANKKDEKQPHLLDKKELRKERKKAQEETGEQKLHIVIGGVKNMPYYFVKCCNATISDELIGFVTRGKGVSIHKKKCGVIRNSDPTRIVPVRVNATGSELSRDDNETYSVQVLVEARDRVGLVRDITATIANENVNILHFFQDPPTEAAVLINFLLEINNFEQLDRLLYKLEKIESVRRACKVN